MDFHPHEIRVLKGLKRESTPEEVAGEVGLPVDAVQRATSWLKTKGLVEVVEHISEDVTLEDEGKAYAEKGLPERQLLNIIGKGMPLEELKKRTDRGVFNIGFGWLRKKGLVEVKDGQVEIISSEETEDERLLGKLARGGANTGELNKEELEALELLKSRKNVVETKGLKAIILKPTKEGLKRAKTLKEDDRISQLTPKMLVTGEWKNRGFRPYDTRVYVKPEPPVLKHPLRRQINKVKRIFIGMGFEEIKGPLVESAFWNFDALFQPQDHPARDMHDTFYLKTPEEVEIESFDRLKGEVGSTHGDGGCTGSTGWGYRWSEETAKKTLLRTHTTAVTARHLSRIKLEELPVKVFSVDKVFRNEAVDYKHLPEFYQVEGIVVDPSVNFRNLLGILKQFYKEMGFERIRFRPGYFPYTEMSVEPEVYFEDRQEWVELGGAGIFRPEVVKPLLGADVPVLAWGLGLDRTVALSLGLKDIRQLYISDLDWLKEN
ncbi:MAG: phenylalanine--tRNA ligase subunit alpha [Candidatus Altiarchaeales archaeon]|nr:phenylalanine--tRNA ligase subunit alpha [Candidatus Altiarchaeales archaeon]MBD3416911.1 phenylalanine--tRNA ligase subunit alpha [Candidatus Altiarchaeales archaeon]